jgi:glycosyltransferase involved in cell wall biosynthesis
MQRSLLARLTGRPNPVALADAARDARDWAQAKVHYAQALESAPGRADLWVQYGHALKESGGLTEAKAAYERALRIDEAVGDHHLQLGHALKLLDDMDGASRAYARAYELEPHSPAVLQEMRFMGLDIKAPVGRERSEELVALDLTDVFFYLRHHDTLSGIQRVQLGIAQALIDLGGADDRPLTYIVDVGGLGAYVELRASAIGRLADELSKPQVSHDRLLSIMAEEESLGDIFAVQPGDAILVFGAFWVIENAIERFVRVKQLGGRLVVLIHDLIPITNPEYCEASLTDVFNMFCVHVLQVADLILTVSDYSGRRVREFLRSKNIAPPPIRTLRTAHQTWQGMTEAGGRPSTRIARLLAKPYVLYVSTIEIRKNHLLLFRIWKALIDKHGPKALPKLIFVGRPGWRVRDLMDQLESTRQLEGRIEIVHGLSDLELAELYRSAMFTAFPSFEEGWGLPVGESLMFGTPCAASNTSSIPEVGGDFVVYEDPHNLNASLALYERMIFDRPYRTGLAARIRAEFQPRTWTEVASDLIGLLAEHVPPGVTPSFTAPVARLSAGRLFNIGRGRDVHEYIRSGLGEQVHFMFDENWGVVEEHVRWQLKRTADVRFRVGYESPREVQFVLFIDTVPWLGETELTITINDQTYRPVEHTPGATSRIALVHTLTSPEVLIRFEISGPLARGSDPRPLSYGLRALGYAARDDILARTELTEAIVFDAAGILPLISLD